MDDDDFKATMRAALAIGSIIIFSVLGIMLLIVAGWEVKAHVDKISPDAPHCTYVDDKGYGHTAPLAPDQLKPAGVQSDAGK